MSNFFQMKYAIVYVSSATPPPLGKEEIRELFHKAKQSNKLEEINGFLLFSEGNFFQVIVGDEEKIKELFSKIKSDPRHEGLLKISEALVENNSENGSEKGFTTANLENDNNNSGFLLHQIELLDLKHQKTVKNILRSFLT